MWIRTGFLSRWNGNERGVESRRRKRSFRISGCIRSSRQSGSFAQPNEAGEKCTHRRAGRGGQVVEEAMFGPGAQPGLFAQSVRLLLEHVGDLRGEVEVVLGLVELAEHERAQVPGDIGGAEDEDGGDALLDVERRRRGRHLGRL